MTWNWWGWGTTEIDNGVLTMVGAADPFGTNTSWVQIDENTDPDAPISPTAAEIYTRFKFTTTGTPDSSDYLHIALHADESFLANLQIFALSFSPTLGLGAYYYENNDEYYFPNTSFNYDQYYWAKIIVDYDGINMVYAWIFGDGEMALGNPDFYWSNGIDNPIESLFLVAGTDDDSSIVHIDQFYYNLIPTEFMGGGNLCKCWL